MSTLTVSELRDHVETDLIDSALQRIVDAEEEELISRFGPRSSQTDVLCGGGLHIFASRPLKVVTSVVEWDGTTATTLVAADYRLSADRRTLERLATGTNQSTIWSDEVTLSYIPDDAAKWTRTLIDLVRLALQYTAKGSESIGDYSSSNLDYAREREKLIAQLRGMRIA